MKLSYETSSALTLAQLEHAIDPPTLLCYHINKLRRELGVDDGFTRIRIFFDLLIITISTEPYDETIDPGWA